jgi:hypothetical protein
MDEPEECSMRTPGDLSRLRAARLQARSLCDFHETKIEKLERELAGERDELVAALAMLDECERQIHAAMTPEVPSLEAIA